MTSVWKRLERVNKRASKFNLLFSFEQLSLEVTPKWQPRKLRVVLWRRSRKVFLEPKLWEPTMKNPMKGMIVWPIPETREISVTVYKDPRTGEYEDKDWSMTIEDVSTGKPRPLATCSLNVKDYATDFPTQRNSEFNMKLLSKKAVSASIKFSVFSRFIKSGKASDDDMQSDISLMSGSLANDIAPLEDFDGDEDDKSVPVLSAPTNSTVRKISDVSNLTNQIDSLIISLSENEKQSPAGISESSLNNSVVEDLPEEFLVQPSEEREHESTLSSKSSSTPKHVSSFEKPFSSNSRISQLYEDSSDCFSLNLSKITEKTEFSESRNQSVLDTTFTASGEGAENMSFLTDASGVQIEFENSAKNSKSCAQSVSFYGQKSSGPRKSYLFLSPNHEHWFGIVT